MLTGSIQEWTRFWWRNSRNRFELFVSDYVVKEISAGDAGAAELRLGAIAGITVLDQTKPMRRLARKISRRLSLPAGNRNDAFHLAIAIDRRMDYLLTWNLRHISNRANEAILREFAEARGLRLPLIVSPFDLLRGEQDEEANDESDS